jgi:hypothetical protein
VLPHTFLATTKSGHVGVFERKRFGGTGKGSGRVGRLPIEQRYGPTVAGVLAGMPGAIDRIERFAQDKLPVILNSQLDWLLSKGTPSTN